MDLILEELSQTDLGFKLAEELLIAVLLWVDDVITFADGPEDQKIILEKINEFAIKHKLKWGKDKCNIMRVGKHNKTDEIWKLGEMVLEETKRYKYLGDIMTPDGKIQKI